jgi:hypothetical protein
MKARARMAAGTVALMVIVGLMPLLASANHQTVTDPNDGKGPLDVHRVAVKGKRARPKWKVVTFSGWSAQSIWDQGYGLVYLDTLGDRHFDYYGLVRSNGYALEGTLWRQRKKKGDVKMGKLQVARSNHRSFTVKIPLRKLEIPAARVYYRWYVQTITTSDVCPRSCFDRAPDDGAVTEPVPGRTSTTTIPPTIVPSVSVTPTPTPSSS